jgi:hypothetical protein
MGTAWRLSILGFALACAALAGIGWTSYRRLVELREASEQVDHTLLVAGATQTILSLVTDAETGNRGSSSRATDPTWSRTGRRSRSSRRTWSGCAGWHR